MPSTTRRLAIVTVLSLGLVAGVIAIRERPGPDAAGAAEHGHRREPLRRRPAHHRRAGASGGGTAAVRRSRPG